MPDLEISKLPALDGTDLADTDVLPIVDDSASETKKINAEDLVGGGIKLLPDKTIPGSKLEDDAIAEDQLADDSVTADAIKDGAVGIDALAKGAVTANAIQDGAVGEIALAADAVTADAIATDAVTADAIKGGAVGADAIATDAVTADALAANSVTTEAISNGSVNNNGLAADAVTADKIADSAVGPGAIANDAVGPNAIATGAVTVDAISAGAVTTDAIAAGAVTNAGLALDSVARENLQANAVGSVALGDNVVGSIHLQDDAVTGPKIEAGSVEADKLGTVTDRGLDQATGSIGIANDTGADSNTANGITFNRQGLITGTGPLTDLPPATDSVIGAVKPGTGLAVDGDGTLNHSNAVVAGGIGGIEYDSEGHITAVPALGQFDRDAIPPAGVTPDEIGGVYIPTGLDVGLVVNAASGELTHEISAVTPGTYPKVTVGPNGHVTAGLSQIEVADLPALIPADRLDGQITNAQLGDAVVEADNLADYATSYMQESQPDTGEFLGQLWWQPSTAQLRIYSRGSAGNQWSPVGFGALQADNLRWGGTFDASTGQIGVVASSGQSDGLTPGSSFPAPSDALQGLYLLCETAGNNVSQPNISGETFGVGDWALCLGSAQGWMLINTAAGGGGGGGGSSTLSGLLDVELSGNQDEDLLKYDNSNGVWRNERVINGGTF